MRNGCTLAMALAIAVLARVLPAQSTQPTTAPALGPMIAALSSDSWPARQKAQADLVELGPPILPQLQQIVEQSQDPEVRTRIEATIRQIEEVRTTGPSYITLHMQRALPKDIFAEISRQAGARLRPSPSNLWEARRWPAADIHIDHEPFWIALKKACDIVGVRPQLAGREMLLSDRDLGNRLFGAAPLLIHGPFLITAGEIESERTVDLDVPAKPVAPGAAHPGLKVSTHVQFTVCVEPKIRVLQGSSVAKIDEAVDEKGQSLLSSNRGSEGISPGNTWTWSVLGALEPPPDAGRQIARLRGSVRFIIQSRGETAEVSNIMSARGVERTVAGKRFIVKEARGNGDSYSIFIQLPKETWTASEAIQFSPERIFRLLDARGLPLMRVDSPRGMDARAGSDAESRQIVLTFQRQNWQLGERAGEPAKLIWEVPVETREVAVPFEFKDLPLP